MDLKELVGFRLSGNWSSGDVGDMGDVSSQSMAPALFAGFSDISRLRHDFPLVLIADGGDGEFVATLSNVIDGALARIAPRDISGERLRKNGLSLENEIRRLAGQGTRGSLSQLWDGAQKKLLARGTKADKTALKENLARLRDAVRVDGDVIDCNVQTPRDVLTHAWKIVHNRRIERACDEIEFLSLKLSGILQADFMKSGKARSPENLKSSVGTAFEAAFDFDAMSRVLAPAAKAGPLSNKRRKRIEEALSTLRSQRFFPVADEHANGAPAVETYDFAFDSCVAALAAYHQRLPEMGTLVKAMAIARLEIENRYVEARHDGFFADFDPLGLEADDLAMFPDYLVCVGKLRENQKETSSLIEALSTELPFKIMAQCNDVLDDLLKASGQPLSGIKSANLARTAVGLGGNTFVFQAGASHLFRVRDCIARGLAYSGPALFSVFSGSPASNPKSTAPAAYLVAAAAVESRAFPVFCFDPSSGADWASRLTIGGNPQMDADWPDHGITYEDAELQRVSERAAFSFVDFVAMDARFAKHFATAPKAKWDNGMIPAGDYLDFSPSDAPGEAPYISMIDKTGGLHRVVADEKVMRAARHCLESWKSLQELGGINNSHAVRLVEAERAQWEQEKEAELATLREQVEEAPAQAAVETTPEAEAEAAPEAIDPDEPRIETLRCTTCNECTQVNPKMFVYNDNKQAYIADLDAGTYLNMVEAAERCQVSIIHPGKPRNSNEPGLEELMARARPFI